MAIRLSAHKSVRLHVAIFAVAMVMTGCRFGSSRGTIYWPAGAIFSKDGNWIYYVTRKTDVTEAGSFHGPQIDARGAGCAGTDIGFTHQSTVWSDEVTLRHIRLSDGLIETLIHWPSTPRAGVTADAHQGFLLSDSGGN